MATVLDFAEAAVLLDAYFERLRNEKRFSRRAHPNSFSTVAIRIGCTDETEFGLLWPSGVLHFRGTCMELGFGGVLEGGLHLMKETKIKGGRASDFWKQSPCPKKLPGRSLHDQIA